MSEGTPITSENYEVTAGGHRRGDVYECGGRWTRGRGAGKGGAPIGSDEGA